MADLLVRSHGHLDERGCLVSFLFKDSVKSGQAWMTF